MKRGKHRGKHCRIVATVLTALVLHGCGVGGLDVWARGADIATGADVDHTTTGVVYKTFAASAGELRVATLNTLRRMDLAVVTDSPAKGTHAIVATARKRLVEITLEPLSGRSSRMRVAASTGEVFLNDAAAAAEIVVQTAATLDDLAQRRQQARQPGQPTG